MKELPLRISARDAFQKDAKTIFPIFLLAYISSMLFSDTDLKGAVIAFFGILLTYLIALLIEIKASYITLSPNGFTYTNKYLKKVSLNWSDDIAVTKGKAGKYECYIILDEKNSHKIYIPVVIFTYPQVKEFIYNNIPKNHKIYALV